MRSSHSHRSHSMHRSHSSMHHSHNSSHHSHFSVGSRSLRSHSSLGRRSHSALSHLRHGIKNATSRTVGLNINRSISGSRDATLHRKSRISRERMRGTISSSINLFNNIHKVTLNNSNVNKKRKIISRRFESISDNNYDINPMGGFSFIFLLMPIVIFLFMILTIIIFTK